MPKYEVVIPFVGGGDLGDVLELDKVHPAFKANLRLVGERKSKTKGGTLTPATPGEMSAKERKAVIAARLTELDIEFKGNFGVDALAELLPEGELEKLFPETDE